MVLCATRQSIYIRILFWPIVLSFAMLEMILSWKLSISSWFHLMLDHTFELVAHLLSTSAILMQYQSGKSFQNMLKLV